MTTPEACGSGGWSGVEEAGLGAGIADSTGIVSVPSARIDMVIEAADAIAAKEAAMAERIDAGQPVADVMGAEDEGMLDGG